VSTPSSSDPLKILRVLVRGWKPTTETVMVSVATAIETMFVAVPLNGEPIVPVLTVEHPVGGTGGPDWSVSPDGSAIVIAVAAGLTTYRLALVDFAHALMLMGRAPLCTWPPQRCDRAGRPESEDTNLTGTWLERFAPAILEGLLPNPARLGTVLLDAVPFHVKALAAAVFRSKAVA
jgi:hypothetical protein